MKFREPKLLKHPERKRVAVTPRTESQPRRIPEYRKSIKIPAILAIFALTTTSCTTEKSAPSKEHLCGVAKDTETHDLLQKALRTDQYRTTIYNTNDRLPEKLADELKQWKPGRTEFTTLACSFTPKDRRLDGSLEFELSWTARDGSTKKDPPGKVSYYNINGALGEANDIITKLRVQCNLPGTLRTPSRQVSLLTKGSNTLSIGMKVDQKMIDQQMTIVYRVAQKATEVLGCENNPLKNDPTIKAYSTPEEAARAGN
ncbi:hypothetical protein PUR57_36780 [Streptomyces sp. JV176]|uniref:hypothetical protein n=1 Tax=Streptomyces sp. JV176 TaxID=858630 RepID=UPI002E773D8B|nr:hypothetical protein [Streptomyces sp. JV176]MEE1804170.1 hypothetical protein [Streptomyces sp. JV176]